MEQKIIPIKYTRKIVNNYLKYPESQNKKADSERIAVINELVYSDSGTLGNFKVTDKDKITPYDSMTVNEVLYGYADNHLRDFILRGKGFTPEKIKGMNDNLWGHKQNDFTYMLNQMATYLVNNEESAYKRNKRHNAERNLDTYDDDDEEDKLSADETVTHKSEVDSKLATAYTFYEKRSKKYPLAPSWEEHNKIKTPHERMKLEQREIYDEIENLRERANTASGLKTKKLLRQMARELQQKLKDMVEGRNVGNGLFANLKNLDREHDICQRIADELNYTNINHMREFIFNFSDISDKFGDDPGNPLYPILMEFRDEAQKIRFRQDRHKEIFLSILQLYTTDELSNARNKKYISELLNMDTEPMMRIVRDSIPKAVVKHFKKHVGN